MGASPDGRDRPQVCAGWILAIAVQSRSSTSVTSTVTSWRSSARRSRQVAWPWPGNRSRFLETRCATWHVGAERWLRSTGRLCTQYNESRHVDATLIRQRCKRDALGRTAGPAEPKDPIGGSPPPAEFTWRGTVFWRPPRMTSRAAGPVPPVPMCHGMPRTGEGRKGATDGHKESVNGQGRHPGPGLISGLVLDAEASADAATDESR